MIAGANDISEKRNRWTVVTMEFGYSCARCHQPPAFEDADAYLLTGHCGACWSAIRKEEPVSQSPLTHL